MRRRHREPKTFALLLLGVLFWGDAGAVARGGENQGDKPLCTIAAIANPYITTLSAKELGGRGFLASTGSAGLRKAIAAANALKPDALVILGSLTWTGSEADFDQFEDLLRTAKVTVHVTPGEKDLVNDGLARYRKRFAGQDASRKSIDIKSVRLHFATRLGTDAKNEGEVLDAMEKDLASAGDSRAVLLWDGLNLDVPNASTPANSPAVRYWRLLDRHKVAVRLVADHTHNTTLENRLPIWSIPSSAWPNRLQWSLAAITVYPTKIRLRLFQDPGQPPQVLEVPNPMAAERLPTAAADPHGCPTYSEDLARKPELTFVQLSDSQLDDGTLPRYKESFRFAEQMSQAAVQEVNRLRPPFVFMTGDLTNTNTPAEWKMFARIYGDLKPPLYTLPGNHDTLYDRAMLNRKKLGDLLESGLSNWEFADRLAGKKTEDPTTFYRHFARREPYYMVEKAGCVFLCLNTGMGAVDGGQMKWLREKLEETKAAKHVFVLGHYPVHKKFGGNIGGPEAEEILGLLNKYKVAAYLSGHRHFYSYHVHERTAHVVCDCLCWGEYLSYQVYHVFPDRIVACWKPLFRAVGNRPLYERVEFPEPRFKD